MTSRAARSAAILHDRTVEGGTRFIDLALTLRVADVDRVEGKTQWRDAGDELVTVGGRWDRKQKCWSGEASSSVPMRLHRGQEESARWFCEWLRGERAGMFSCTLLGGRRSGKSHEALVFLIAYAVMCPGAQVWAVSPVLEASEELDRVLGEMLPASWHRRTGHGTGHVTTFALVNGSKIRLLSGRRPLRRGRVDVCLLNEAQEQSEATYASVRAAVADRSGLVVMTANPPSTSGGQWLAEHFLATQAGEIAGVSYELDPRRNPWIDYAALESMRAEMSEREYQREVLGIITAPEDRVMFGWSDRDSWKDPTPDLIDITAEVTRRELGRSAAFVMGVDFQRRPFLASAMFKVFRDPKEPGSEIMWCIDECLVEQGTDEGDLLTELEAQGYRGWVNSGDDPQHPTHVASVMDASAWWQDSTHQLGKQSERVFSARKWTHNYRPQSDSDRNPAIDLRLAATNARLKAADGVRRMFVARKCVRTAEALRRYELKAGVPNRRSIWAHQVDAVTYAAWRLYGRVRGPGNKIGYVRTQRFTRRDQMRAGP